MAHRGAWFPRFNNRGRGGSFEINPGRGRRDFEMRSGRGMSVVRPFHETSPFQNAPFNQYQSCSSHPNVSSQPMFNRPRFGNFGDHCIQFGNRLPDPSCMPRPRLGPPVRPRFSPPVPFEPHFTPWDSRPSFRNESPFGSGPRTFTPQSFSKRPPAEQDDSDQPQRKRLRKMKEREDKKLKPWMTDEIFQEVQKKNALYFKAKKNNNEESWQEFRLQRNRVSSLIKDAKFKAGVLTRKVKEEGDDGVEKPFSCDTCDRAFVSEDQMNKHIAEHVKCDSENCKFEAHPKVVALHKKMQHATGYADIINKLKDDEEIKKWREERKSRFPTAENIQKRKAEQAEKEARGEVLETKEFGKFKGQRTQWGRMKCNNRYTRNNEYNSRRPYNRRKERPASVSQPLNNAYNSDSDSDSCITLKQFSGMSSLEEQSHQREFEHSSENTGNSSDCLQNDIGALKHKQFPVIANIPHENLTTFTETVNSHCNNMCSGSDSMKSDHHLCVDSDIVEVSDNDARQCVEDLSRNVTSKANTIVIEDSDNDSVDSVEVLSSTCKNKIIGAVTLEDSDDAPEEIPIIKSTQDETNSVIHRTDSDAPEQIPIIKSTQNETNSIIQIPDSDDAPEEVPFQKSSETENVDSQNQLPATNVDYKTTRSRQYNNNFNGRNFNPAYTTRKSTLLEKLLADDIRHERNVILQCVRYIVKNNFFEIEEDDS